MKKILVTLAFATALVFGTQAQNAVPTTLNGGTNNVLAAATNTYNIDMVLPQNTRMVSFEAVAALNGAGTGTAQFNLSKSIDQSTNSFSSVTNVVLTMSGTTQVNKILDIDPGGARFWRLTTAWNTNSAALTNIQFGGYATKSAN